MVSPNSLPPQNIEAEESILGGILLDPEAMGRVVDLMVADAFYVKAHRDIYEAALKLHAQGKPTDLMTVTNSLQDYHLLEKVGGMGKLAQLVDRTVSAVNIDRYAALVMDKYLRRQLISAGHEIIELGYDTTQELDVVFDECEKKIFRLTQKRPQEGLISISETLVHTFNELEKLHQKTASPGLETDFYDLDAITGGLQRSDLIILAGRPSMGKTAFGLNIASNIAKKHNLLVAIFSLEMSKEQLALRFLASEAGIDSNRLRTGHFSQNELEPLSMALGSLSSLPIFIDDASNISVMQMRSQVRRLQSEQKGKIGLVLIDYLQLMEGASDNRVQEISKMTRSLKGLAREINAPVIALSQLSRGVESRTNKRPMMSDLRECVTGDTLVSLADGRRLPIKDLVGQQPDVVTMDEKGKIGTTPSDVIWEVGKKSVYRLITATGKKIRATDGHRFFTLNGWMELKDLKKGDRLAAPRLLPEPKSPTVWNELDIALLGQLIGDGSYIKGSPLRYTTASEENSEIVTIAAQQLGSTVKRYKGKGNWHQLLISGNGNRWHPKGVNKWLRGLGIFGQRSATKRIPSQAFLMSNKQVSLLLQHLWATDGCISIRNGRGGDSIFFATISEGLAYDVSTLLLRLGILSTVRLTKDCFNVIVQGTLEQLKFLERVGGFGPRAKKVDELKEKIENIIPNPNQDTIPLTIFEIVKSEMKEQEISHREMAKLRGTAYGGSAHYKHSPSRSTLENYASILNNQYLMELATSDIFWDTVVSVEYDCDEVVYDLTVPKTSSWIANGIVSHNSGSIEQDADLIMMIYRDEYYNPDSPDRGIAELLITKHRNGPTGVIKLLFKPEFTQFLNLQKYENY